MDLVETTSVEPVEKIISQPIAKGQSNLRL
jgi:hypothetical protein